MNTIAKRGMKPQQAAEIRARKGLNETKLQRLRVAKGYSQSELAEKADIAKRTVQYYEIDKDKINGAKLKTLCKLSSILDCKIADILESEELIKIFNETK